MDRQTEEEKLSIFCKKLETASWCLGNRKSADHASPGLKTVTRQQRNHI